MKPTPCETCDGWGEVRNGDHIVACPTCQFDAYEETFDD